MAVSADVSVVRAIAAIAFRLAFEAHRQFRREVLGVGGAAAVAEKQELTALSQTAQALRHQLGEWPREREPCPLEDGCVFGELGLVVALQIHADSCRAMLSFGMHASGRIWANYRSGAYSTIALPGLLILALTSIRPLRRFLISP